MDKWISSNHWKRGIRSTKTRVQYAILDQLNYMVSNHIATPNEVKEIVLNEITEITNEAIQEDLDEN